MHTQKRLLGFMLRVGAALAISIVATPAISAPIEWVTVGSPNTTKDDTGYGAVGYEYQMAKYETTNAQYVEFLNAVADKDDVHGLYSAAMASSVHGGIARQGSVGGHAYSVREGMGNKPVNAVGFYDALRFMNWLHNGKGSSDTETGAYELNGSSSPGVVRNVDALFFLPTEDEWYKAALFNAVETEFSDYPTPSNAPVACGLPGTSIATANCGSSLGSVGDVGMYQANLYGISDLAGNVWEWVDADVNGSDFGILRGGGFKSNLDSFTAARFEYLKNDISYQGGFRVAGSVAVPEPGTGLLVLIGLVGLARARAGRGI